MKQKSNQVEVQELFGELKCMPNSKWYAVYTKPRHEKRVANACVDYGISYFLPLQDSVRYYQNRVVRFTKPLFSGYIFCNCNHEQKITLYRTGLLVTFIPATDQDKLVKELQQIIDAKSEGVEVVPHKYLTRGRKAKIIKGPFKDYEGKISYKKGSYKLVLNINLIRQAIAIEIDAKHIKLID